MKTTYTQIENGKGFWSLLLLLAGMIAVGLAATFYMEHNGHWVTGMDNQIVWGMPHVFAIFLIVAASGALNVASIGSVFGRKMYKPLAPLSALLAVALLVGGLAVLVLDLGRPDRLAVAMTTFNFKSIFTWNVILYNGFLLIVGIYLWTMLEKRMNKHKDQVGIVAFVWRLVLTTGTGSIFGWLVARQAYDAAILAPMFVVMSFSFGLAFYLLVLLATYQLTGREVGDYVLNRLKSLLGVFVASVLYFVMVYHFTNLYAAEHTGIEHFILLNGGIFTLLFWLVQIIIGSLVPLALIYAPQFRQNRSALTAAAILVLLGGLAQVYVILIGGQAYPLINFPGYEVSSTFADGIVNSYVPTLAEFLLGFMGVAITLIMVAVAIAALRILPSSLADKVMDPHALVAAQAKK
ncbi:MAG: polysulfide reductase NrfD [Gammaproteobacteria bacterium]|nr:polysulfide reductase NrfD [Gammaproteobacteria bacterium]